MSPGDQPFPTQPRAFGEELRRLRTAADVSLEDIAAETKVSLRILEALESGKFQYLPEPVFVRNFVRQYARAVGFDADRLVGWFDAAWERFNLASGVHTVLHEVEPPPRHSVPWRFWLPLGLAALILLAVAVVVWHARSTRTPVAGLEARATVAAIASPPSLPSPLPPTAVPSPSPTGTASALPTDVHLVVRVAAGRECWLRYRDGEGRTEQRLLSGGGAASYDLPEPVLLTLGSAGVAVVEVNGQTYRDLGRPGEVVHVELTHEGAHVLASGVDG